MNQVQEDEADKTILITQDRDNLVRLAGLLDDRAGGRPLELRPNAKLWEMVFRRTEELLEKEREFSRIHYERRMAQ